MNIFLLIMVMAASLFQSIAKKQYNQKTNDRGAYVFNAVTTLSAGIFFLLTDENGFSYDVGLIPYVLGFAAAFGSAVFFSFLAIRVGSLSLTSLATSYSLIIPALYGLFFLNEKASPFLYVGIAFLLCSLFLVNNRKGDGKISLKWFIFAFLAFLGNGLCSTIQTSQQLRFKGQYKSEFMVSALLILAVFFFVLSFTKEKEESRACLKIKNLPVMVFCGVANGLVNLFVMMLVSRGMPASIMFPVISGGGIILTALVSVIVYKEKLSVKQYIGLFFGTVSVVLMNL